MAISVGWGKRKPMVAGFCLLAVLAGAWRFGISVLIPTDDISRQNGAELAFEGLIVEPPAVKTASQQIVVEALRKGDQELAGKVLITLAKYSQYDYGDRLEISGQLKEPENFDDFDYRNYLAKDDIYSVMYQPQITVLAEDEGNAVKAGLYDLKDSFEEKLSRFLPEPQLSLAEGLVLGEKDSLPTDLTDAFNVAGITHIIALSGFNITIIAESLRRLFGGLMIRRQYSFWLAVAFIAGFVLMTGASASVMRAAVMGCLVLVAQQLGRFYAARNALILAGAAMIFFDPKILRFDLSFQLSFLATTGLIYISPLIEKYLWQLTDRFDLRGILSATLGAQIAVLPLILQSFGRLSVIAPLANLLILPFIPQTMLLTFLSGLGGWFAPVAGQILGWLAWLFLTYEIKAAEILAAIPLASLNVKIGVWMMIILYALLFFLVFKNNKTRMLANRLPEV